MEECAGSSAQHLALLAGQAEAVLRRSLGAPVRLTEPVPLSEEGRRSLLVRCAVADGPGGAPAAVVIKQARPAEYRPDDPESWAAVGLLRDWAGLELLSSSAAGLAAGAPRFYGGDRAAGLVVMEDLGPGEDLARVLCAGSRPRAEAALVQLAAALGRMHAATADLAERYAELRRALGPGDEQPRAQEARDVRDAPARWEAGCAALGLGVEPGLRADAEAVAQAMEHPGPFLAYTTGDPCLDNALLAADGRVRLHDFEVGAFRHALRDGVYGQMRFPSCWCVQDLPEAVVRRMDAAYRSALAAGCPQARDDARYREAVAQACAAWLLTTVGWTLSRALAFDGVWGIATHRQRIARRLRTAAAALADSGCLPGLRGTAERLYECLAARWGDTLPLYDAFRREREAPSELVAALFAGIEAGDAPAVAALLPRDPDLAAACSPDGEMEPALCRAARQDRLAIVTALLDAGAGPGTIAARGGSALAAASAQGHTAVMALLLQRGADPEVRDLRGASALVAAARGGHAAALLRQAGAEVDLAAAIALDEPDAVALVLAADPAARDAALMGGAPLHLAAAEGRVRALGLLLDRGADLEQRDGGGATALHRAARHGQLAAVTLLLARGADPEARDGEERTPLQRAEEAGQAACAGVLRRAMGAGQPGPA